jgi:hypothetical protein
MEGIEEFCPTAARNRATNNKESYRQQLEDILTSGTESTAGIVWKGIPPGNYDILIEAVNQENRHSSIFQ